MLGIVASMVVAGGISPGWWEVGFCPMAELWTCWGVEFGCNIFYCGSLNRWFGGCWVAWGGEAGGVFAGDGSDFASLVYRGLWVLTLWCQGNEIYHLKNLITGIPFFITLPNNKNCNEIEIHICNWAIETDISEFFPCYGWDLWRMIQEGNKKQRLLRSNLREMGILCNYSIGGEVWLIVNAKAFC